MATASNSHAEKRDFIRMTINTPAEVIVINDGKQESGTCLNLSASGMLLALANSYPVDTTLIVKIASGHGHNPSIEAECKVIRSDAASGDMFEIGVRIERLL
jgi:hypothetical protein